MTLAQRELLFAARLMLETAAPRAYMVDWARAATRLQSAVAAVEAEDADNLPSIDVPAHVVAERF